MEDRKYGDGDLKAFPLSKYSGREANETIAEEATAGSRGGKDTEDVNLCEYSAGFCDQSQWSFYCQSQNLLERLILEVSAFCSWRRQTFPAGFAMAIIDA